MHARSPLWATLPVALLIVSVILSGCASTLTARRGTLANGEPLVTLVVSEDRQVVHRECQDVLALDAVVGCQISRPVALADGVAVRAVKIVRYTDALPSQMAFDIDVHELCHAIAAVQGIDDPCHTDGGGILYSTASRRLLTR